MNESVAADAQADQIGARIPPAARRPIRVLTADDHEAVRRGIREVIKNEPSLEMCGEAVNGSDAVEKVRRLKPDIVLMDINMPGLNGLEATRRIAKEVPNAEVLVLTAYDSENLIAALLNAGARGYLLKSDVAADLLAAIGSVSQQRPFFTSKAAKMVLQGYLEASAKAGGSTQSLTVRERQIVQLLAEGKSSKEVATILDVSVKTAETHRTNLMRKLDIHSICDLVHYAIRNQIIEA
ncbi:MAG: response regulator [Terriglobia bacterium]